MAEAVESVIAGGDPDPSLDEVANAKIEERQRRAQIRLHNQVKLIEQEEGVKLVFTNKLSFIAVENIKEQGLAQSAGPENPEG
jgi:ATP-dependent protease HslVU (ClpYQ) ATPase subunit